MGISDTRNDFGGELAAREEWLPKEHPDRIAWEKRRADERENRYIEKAKKFHEAYERLAPQFGYETRQETREFDPNSPNGRLMVAVMKELD
jgi:hypothetical protein